MFFDLINPTEISELITLFVYLLPLFGGWKDFKKGAVEFLPKSPGEAFNLVTSPIGYTAIKSAPAIIEHMEDPDGKLDPLTDAERAEKRKSREKQLRSANYN